MQKKATKMDVFVNKLYVLMDFVYELIKNSFFFWLYLLRGLGVITLFSSIKVLTAVSLDVVHKDRKKTFSNFKENYKNTDRSRFFSLFTFFLLLYLSAIIFIPFPEHLEGTIWYGAKYVAMFVVALSLLLMFTRPVFDRVFPEVAWSIPVQVYSLIKGFKWTLLLAVGMIVTLYFSLQNFIFLFAFAPGILGAVSAYTGEKISEHVMKVNQ